MKKRRKKLSSEHCGTSQENLHINWNDTLAKDSQARNQRGIFGLKSFSKGIFTRTKQEFSTLPSLISMLHLSQSILRFIHKNPSISFMKLEYTSSLVGSSTICPSCSIPVGSIDVPGCIAPPCFFSFWPFSSLLTLRAVGTSFVTSARMFRIFGLALMVVPSPRTWDDMRC